MSRRYKARQVITAATVCIFSLFGHVLQAEAEKIENAQESKELDAVELALRKSPNNFSALARKGTMLWRMDDPDGAIEALNQALKIAPANNGQLPSLYEALANAYYAKGQKEKALVAFDSLLHCQGDRFVISHAHFGRASIFEDKGENNRALQELDMAIKSVPADKYLHDAKGSLLIKLKQYKAAIAELSTAIKLAPHDSTVYAKRAQAYEALGEKELGREDRHMAESLSREAF
jgi:tetratricopeptide (TPR) repeat protein